MPNRLADATSPYLLQHADNPVAWWEWSDEAFADARSRDVPIFLSVGYSSCHWCHVMAHESFEDEEVAAYLNEHFTNIKVDREERPDVDSVYMAATQALTGRGGWPMSVFLDHEGRPFHAGTYWPRRRRGGMPGFPEVLTAVSEAWHEQREKVTHSASAIADQLRDRMAQPTASADDAAPAEDVLERATDQIVGSWDRRHGGFGRAPKFPQAMAIGFLLDQHVVTGHEQALEAATHSLRAMVRGGIHDQLTGGFARYSTDERWLVPHFEKMLYDNALLLGVLADASSLVADDELLAEGAHRTAAAIDDWFEHDSGAFIAATDADSEGEEGRYFVFDHGEAVQVLQAAGLDAERWTSFLGIVPAGNWEGTNVVHEAVDRDAFRATHDLDDETFERELFAARSALAAAREERVPPGADDKLIAAWIGLAVRGLVTAGDRLARPELYTIADNALTAVEERLLDDGRLHRTWRDGRRGVGGFLEDHAAVADAALALAERTGDTARFALARRLAEHTLEAFAAPDGGLFTTAEDAEELWTRPRDEGDNAVPSGTALLAEVLLRLAALTGEHDLRERAESLLAPTTASLERWPTGFGQTLRAHRWALADQVEVAVVGPPGEERDALVAAAVATPRPGLVTFVSGVDSDGRVPEATATQVPLLAGRGLVDGRPAAYVCQQFTCQLPVTTPEALREQLAGASSSR